MINLKDVISRDNKALIVQSEINAILNSWDKYVLFDISVLNAGGCVRFETSNEYSDFDEVLGEENWDGCSYAITVAEFEEQLEEFGTVLDIDGKLAFIWELV